MKANEVGSDPTSASCLNTRKQLGLQGDCQGGVLEEVMKQKDTIRGMRVLNCFNCVDHISGLQKEKELLTQKLEEQARNQELSDIQSQSEEYLKLRQVNRHVNNFHALTLRV